MFTFFLDKRVFIIFEDHLGEITRRNSQKHPVERDPSDPVGPRITNAGYFGEMARDKQRGTG